MSEPPFDPKDFRQAPVASLDVILGFLIGFVGQWVTEDDFALRSLSDTMVSGGMLGGSLLLFVALFRLLSPNVPPEKALAHHRVTPKLTMAGIATTLGSILASALI